MDADFRGVSFLPKKNTGCETHSQPVWMAKSKWLYRDDRATTPNSSISAICMLWTEPPTKPRIAVQSA